MTPPVSLGFGIADQENRYQLLEQERMKRIAVSSEEIQLSVRMKWLRGDR